MLHRLAEVDVDHRRHLRSGLRLLTAAAMLTDDELDGLLARYSAEADADVGAPGAERSAAAVSD